jgi:cytochrome c oxidase subunit 2
MSTEDGRRPRIVLGLILFFALITILTVAMFAMPWRSEVASEEGKGIDSVITYLLFATGGLVILGHVVLIKFLWGGRGEGEYKRPTPKVEWMWGLIPVVVMMVVSEAGVLIVGSPTWDLLYVTKPVDPINVEVIGKQFEWMVRYPGKDGKFGAYNFKWVDGQDNPLGLDEDDEAATDDIFVPVLRLPLGRPAVLHLRTHDVLHSFFVPEFRVKQDLIPGFDTSVKFTPSRTGTFELGCAELCGFAHYRMKTKVIVMEPGEFNTWLNSQVGFFEDEE